MSTIRYDINELATRENIEWLNSLISKIRNCGNDHIIIHNTYNETDVSSFLNFISNVHITNSNQSIEMFNEYVLE